MNFASGTAQVGYWTSTTIVVTVPSTNSVSTGSADGDDVRYRAPQPVPVTVTPQGATASDAVTFLVDASSDRDDD